MTLCLMFDTNAYDRILAHDDAERILDMPINVVTTRVQEDELHQIADIPRRLKLLELYHALGGETVTLNTRWDAARDAMIAAAAKTHCDLFVTDDQALADQLAQTARAIPDVEGLRVLTYADFRAEFLDLD